MHRAFSSATVISALAVVVPAVIAACSSAGNAPRPTFTAPDAATTDVAPDQACGGEPTFAAIRQSVFNKSCSFGSCHGGATPAAGLDLSSDRACALLVGHPSCVFSNRTRVVPGDPEHSYLYAKIVGQDLGTNPDGTCAGLANGTPSRMPIGGEPLCQGAIDQVKAWIAAGAPCDSSTTDGGDDSSSGDAKGDGAGPPVSSLTSTVTTVAVNGDLTVTLTLAGAAPPPGLLIPIASSNPAVLAAPTEVFIEAGDTSATFLVKGVSAGSAEVDVESAKLPLTVTAS